MCYIITDSPDLHSAVHVNIIVFVFRRRRAISVAKQYVINYNIIIMIILSRHIDPYYSNYIIQTLLILYYCAIVPIYYTYTRSFGEKHNFFGRTYLQLK